MTGIRLHVGMHLVENLPAAPSRTEKVHILSPPEGHHYADAEFVGQVEKPFRWSMVDAHAIHSDVTHHREIDAGFLRRTDIIAAGVRRERAICDTLEEELVIAFEEELCACAHPVVHSGTGTESNTTCPAGKILNAEGLSITGEDSRVS